MAARLSLRCSSLLIEVIFEAAKYGATVSLGMPKQALTGAISVARQADDPNFKSVQIRQVKQDYALEKYTTLGVYVVHSTFTLAELFAMSGLQLTAKTIKNSLKAAEESVRIIDGIFGSNQTSRAIASIVTLIHHELMHDPEFELAKVGKVAILAGLTKALTAFAMLQNVTYKRMMKQVKITVLWQGLVVEENPQPASVQETEKQPEQQDYNPDHDKIIREMEEIIASQQKRTGSGNDFKRPVSFKFPCDAFERNRTTTCTNAKTTSVRPLNQSRGYLANADYAMSKSGRENDQTNMNFIDRDRFRPGTINPTNVFDMMFATIPNKSSGTHYDRHDNNKDSTSIDSHVQNCQSEVGSVTAIKQTVERLHYPSTEQYKVQDDGRSSHGGDSILSWNSSKVSGDSQDSLPSLSHIRSGPNENNPKEWVPPKRFIDQCCSDQLSPTSRSSSIASMASISGVARTFAAYAKAPLTSMTSSPKQNTHQLDCIKRNFPRDHLINNVARFMRYSSAAYGESFMRILGIGNIPTNLPTSSHHHEHHPNHHVFAHHTKISVNDILLSSYTDYSVLNMHHPSIHALVHYITVDHAAQSIVLTCRGTLGLSDVLTDLTCGYTEFTLPTDDRRRYKAHSGMLDAAQLLAKKTGRVHQIICDALESFPEYGLVLCGHSLGAGVTSLLSVLWSEECAPLPDNTPFVTSSCSGLPPGRPIHCYSYAPPCVMSLELSEYCGRGLTTSVVHAYDIVCSLSLGLLKDFKNVAMSLHRESNVADEIMGKIVGRFHRHTTTKTEKEEGVGNSGPSEDEQWFWALIKTMRADMCADKLYPPSTVYHIESILQPEVIGQKSKTHKVTLSRCDDVQARFSEIVFSRTMFIDHSPNMYEDAIERLYKGYFGETSNNKS
ncbi:hypothetical protein DFQ30_009372 [Apophysomyces sp. BC1015]|nr:hypothetical protein DFQ30_009372 [Apophysomyces sp. BC1015]KAG0178071.1 hypothetical protein DFQ29_003976 [Apophysomyces sp. BC1021]